MYIFTYTKTLEFEKLLLNLKVLHVQIHVHVHDYQFVYNAQCMQSCVIDFSSYIYRFCEVDSYKLI